MLFYFLLDRTSGTCWHDSFASKPMAIEIYETNISNPTTIFKDPFYFAKNVTYYIE